jgi:hypothetical protein
MGTDQKIDRNINVSKQLAEHAIQIGSSDNITALVIFL